MGKILVLSLVSSFGTTAIAANAVANNLSAICVLPGNAISLAMITVVGQCVGAMDYGQARTYTKRLVRMSTLYIAAIGALIVAALPLILNIYQLSPDTTRTASEIIIFYCICAAVMWSFSFVLPNALRASNDVKFTMIVSVASMWTFRIGFSFVLGKFLHMGLFGVWVAMVIDWVCRITFSSCASGEPNGRNSAGSSARKSRPYSPNPRHRPPDKVKKENPRGILFLFIFCICFPYGRPQSSIAVFFEKTGKFSAVKGPIFYDNFLLLFFQLDTEPCFLKSVSEVKAFAPQPLSRSGASPSHFSMEMTIFVPDGVPEFLPRSGSHIHGSADFPPPRKHDKHNIAGNSHIDKAAEKRLFIKCQKPGILHLRHGAHHQKGMRSSLGNARM